MQRVTAVIPKPGLTGGLGGTTAMHHLVLAGQGRNTHSCLLAVIPITYGSVSTHWDHTSHSCSYRHDLLLTRSNTA